MLRNRCLMQTITIPCYFIAAHSLFTLHMSSNSSLYALSDQETRIERKAKCRMTSASISLWALEALFIYPPFHVVTRCTAAPENQQAHYQS